MSVVLDAVFFGFCSWLVALFPAWVIRSRIPPDR